MKQSMSDLGRHIASGKKAVSETTAGALKILRAALAANHPRSITGTLSDHVHLYVDASYEPDGLSGLGGVCVSSKGEILGFFSEQVPEALLKVFMSGEKETIILELEMLAICMAVNVWKDKLKSHRVVLFTDNESVRSSLLKGYSSNEVVDVLMKDFYKLEEELRCQVWLERVPSQSNPADEPSRKVCFELLGCTNRVRVDAADAWGKVAHFSGGDSAA